MVWAIEVSPQARQDIVGIYRHLVRAHHESFGHDLAAADQRATARIDRIVAGFARIAAVGRIGTLRHAGEQAYRHVSLDGTVYCFTLDEDHNSVRIIGIFHGGQDHLGRMLARLTAEGGDAAPPPP